MQLKRLRGRKLCERVLRKGDVWRGKTLKAHILKGAPMRPGVDPEENAVYLGTFAHGKLHKSAVKRNRARRRMREAFRTAITEHDNLPTMQLLASPQSSSLDCDFSDIQADVQAVLSSVTS